MALTVNQSISLNGVSKINDSQVATFTTNVSADQLYSNVSMQIVDQNLYAANKEEVRNDRTKFVEQADGLADSLENAE